MTNPSNNPLQAEIDDVLEAVIQQNEKYGCLPLEEMSAPGVDYCQDLCPDNMADDDVEELQAIVTLMNELRTRFDDIVLNYC